MLILEARGIKKYFGDRLIVGFDSLMIYEGDRIGVVGLNGAGKTTLFNLLSGNLQPDEGDIRLHGELRYITQFGGDDGLQGFLSGGERTGAKIADALNSPAHLLMADEPTSNLDIYAIEELQKNLRAYMGAVLLISHDRGLLNKTCNKILEIENGGIKIFEGNYAKYRRQKDMELERMELDYEEAVSERKRLANTKQHARERLEGMRKTPKRMGNSEARLHKNPPTGQRKQERFIKNIDRRIDEIEEKIDKLPKRQEMKRVRIDISKSTQMISKTALTVDIKKVSAGSRELIRNVNFSIKTGAKAALIGANGTGKTTLVRLIINAATDNGDPGKNNVRIANTARIAYFAQDLSILDNEGTIYSNVAESSLFDQGEIRSMLARLGFRREDVYKKIRSLSGGEKVKACLAKIFAADVNMLILDEPTNYLDIYAAEALEGLLKEYPGTVLLITHDQEIIENVADNLLIIENGEIISFSGSMAEYRNQAAETADTSKLLMLENRLAFIDGRLTAKSGVTNEERDVLDAEYKKLAAEIRELKGAN